MLKRCLPAAESRTRCFVCAVAHPAWRRQGLGSQRLAYVERQAAPFILMRKFPGSIGYNPIAAIRGIGDKNPLAAIRVIDYNNRQSFSIKNYYLKKP